jgi:hypothetical protein
MTDRSDAQREVAQALRSGERDREWLAAHPAALEPYRGEWVVIHERRVVAHDQDGRRLARLANARSHPGSSVLYVPRREEAEAVQIL